jgi:hypothetical protein
MIDLTTQPAEYVRCRTVGHSWDDFVPVGMRRPSFGFRLSLLCTSCGMERHDLVNTRGDVLQREYRAPDDYTIRGGAPARADYRVELARRGGAVMAITAGPDDGEEHDSATRDDLWGRGSSLWSEGERARAIIEADAQEDDDE